MIDVNISATVRGGLFSKNIERLVQKQIDHEILTKIDQRVQRGGKGLGARRNTITGERQGFYALTMTSTRVFPRTKGTSWQRKNIAIIKSMAPRVARATAKRIAEELS